MLSFPMQRVHVGYAPCSKMSGSVLPPGYCRPHAFVKVVDDDFCHDFHGRNRARDADLPGHKEADNERVDAGCNSPTDGFRNGAPASLPALEQIHLSSTRRLNGAALDRIIGRKRGGSTSLQICPTITSCHVCSARHDDTNWPRRLLSCCETP